MEEGKKDSLDYLKSCEGKEKDRETDVLRECGRQIEEAEEKKNFYESTGIKPLALKLSPLPLFGDTLDLLLI